MIERLVLSCLIVCSVTSLPAQQRWTIQSDGIHWQVGQDLPHDDHIEMSGSSMAFVLRWGVDCRGAFHAERSLVFPMLRTVPDNTHASLMHRMAGDIPSLVSVDGFCLQKERVEQVQINGSLATRSVWEVGRNKVGAAKKTIPNSRVRLSRMIFPSQDLPLMCERYVLHNIGDKPLSVSIPEFSQVVTTDPAKGTTGSYVVRGDILGSGIFTLVPTDSVIFDAVFQAYRIGDTPLRANVGEEYAKRMAFVCGDVGENLQLDTPDEVINTQFRYAKLRAAESIVKTDGGYMHAPGGESYYAAIWANDQAEYVNPFFPFLGYGLGNESALNAFRHFARFMNPEYTPLPSSIIAQGRDVWGGAGDRGDAAMVAYGAARYVLARGDKAEARELWPLIEWCLEYCRKQVNSEGVVASDSDELEGRFPAGDANLCTSTLYYDALLSAQQLGRELGVKSASVYKKQAEELAQAIERYFGADVQGYHTYRYYAGNTLLRSWICMPLIVGLEARSEGTIAALLSPEMLTDDGLLTQQGSTTFWDRSTLYALRGVYVAGDADRATEWLRHYSGRRLLGDHVPYPIEAWPEGSQRQLSAESGLYCRIVTEGLFGIRPTGLRSFDLAPRLPSEWPSMALRHIRAFGSNFDVTVERLKDDNLRVVVAQAGAKPRSFKLRAGAALHNITLTE